MDAAGDEPFSFLSNCRNKKTGARILKLQSKEENKVGSSHQSRLYDVAKDHGELSQDAINEMLRLQMVENRRMQQLEMLLQRPMLKNYSGT
jgi:hypothetical protein